MVVMMVMMTAAMLIMLTDAVMSMTVLMFMMMPISAGLRLLLFRGDGFDAAHPAGRSGHLVETEHPGVEYQAQVYLSVIALEDTGRGLDAGYDMADAGPPGRRDLPRLFEQDYVSELSLLSNNILDIIPLQVLLPEAVPTRQTLP